jgi:hypothetical protein
MLKYQRGVTMLGWLFLLTPLAILGYAGVRLTPIYLNYMNVNQALKQVSTEVSGNSPTSDAIRRSLETHLDVSGVTFPDVKDFKITRVDGVWTVEAAYDDQAPLFANVFILVSFDKTVTLKASE